MDYENYQLKHYEDKDEGLGFVFFSIFALIGVFATFVGSLYGLVELIKWAIGG